jgi:hypothetical protein
MLWNNWMPATAAKQVQEIGHFIVSITIIVVSLNPAHGEVYSMQQYVLKFVSDLRQVGGFLQVLRFPPPIKQRKHSNIYQPTAVELKITASTGKHNTNSHRKRLRCRWLTPLISDNEYFCSLVRLLIHTLYYFYYYNHF